MNVSSSIIFQKLRGILITNKIFTWIGSTLVVATLFFYLIRPKTLFQDHISLSRPKTYAKIGYRVLEKKRLTRKFDYLLEMYAKGNIEEVKEFALTRNGWHFFEKEKSKDGRFVCYRIFDNTYNKNITFGIEAVLHNNKSLYLGGSAMLQWDYDSLWGIKPTLLYSTREKPKSITETYSEQVNDQEYYKKNQHAYFKRSKKRYFKKIAEVSEIEYNPLLQNPHQDSIWLVGHKLDGQHTIHYSIAYDSLRGYIELMPPNYSNFFKEILSTQGQEYVTLEDFSDDLEILLKEEGVDYWIKLKQNLKRNNKNL